MRWKAKETLRGLNRRKIKFAWFPKETNDKMVVWLEKYLSFQTYTGATKMPFGLGWKDYYQEKSVWSQSSTMWDEWADKI